MPLHRIASRVDFEQAVQLGLTHESKHLEFKASYSWRGAAKKSDEAEEACRDIAQFANADGGVLLVGVSEAITADGRRVAGSIRPVEEIDGLIRVD